MKVALTGGIAEGKSTILAHLRASGIAVESADRIAREVFDTAEVNGAIADLVGVASPIEPARLRAALMVDPSIRRAVNALMHEPIVERMEASSAVVIEVPLLYESCLQSRFQYVLVAACGRETQRLRLVQRYGPEVDFEAILASQLPSEVKVAFADRVIRTDQPLDTVHMNIDAWAQETIARSN